MWKDKDTPRDSLILWIFMSRHRQSGHSFDTTMQFVSNRINMLTYMWQGCSLSYITSMQITVVMHQLEFCCYWHEICQSENPAQRSSFSPLFYVLQFKGEQYCVFKYSLHLSLPLNVGEPLCKLPTSSVCVCVCVHNWMFIHLIIFTYLSLHSPIINQLMLGHSKFNFFSGSNT